MLEQTTVIASTSAANNAHIHASGLLAMMHEEKNVEMGYVVVGVLEGRWKAKTEYATKNLPNGRCVNRATYYPASLEKYCHVTEIYAVWVDSEVHTDNDYKSPPCSLPAGATSWRTTTLNGIRNWFANFVDMESAEAYASSVAANDAALVKHVTH